MVRRRTFATLLAVLTVLALVATACSDDDGGGDATIVDDDPSEGDDSGDSDEPEADDSEDPSTDEAEDEVPEELPASAPGVTSTAVKVGIAVPDFELLAQYNVPNYHGSNEVAFPPFIDAINEAGGIFGRMIEPVYVSYDFLDPATQDAACVEFADDEEVFIVLYGMLAANNLCLTELNDVMVITEGFQTAPFVEASDDTLWLSLNAGDDAIAGIMAGTLAEGGFLDGKTVGIIGSVDEPVDAVKAVLDDKDIPAIAVVTVAGSDDPTAFTAEIGLVAEQFRVGGVDFIIDVVGAATATEGFIQAGFTPEMAFISLDATVGGISDTSIIDGALSVSQAPDASFWFDDPVFKEECIDPIVAANPELADQFLVLPDGDAQAGGEPNWALPTLTACNMTRLLKQAGELAGAELTNETFAAALEELGSIEILGYGQGSFRFSDGKWDLLDQFEVQRYDDATGTIEVIGDPVVIDR